MLPDPLPIIVYGLPFASVIIVCATCNLSAYEMPTKYSFLNSVYILIIPIIISKTIVGTKNFFLPISITTAVNRIIKEKRSGRYADDVVLLARYPITNRIVIKPIKRVPT